jgi:hypothetical protein
VTSLVRPAIGGEAPQLWAELLKPFRVIVASMSDTSKRQLGRDRYVRRSLTNPVTWVFERVFAPIAVL